MTTETDPEPSRVLIVLPDGRLLEELTASLPMCSISKASRSEEAERLLGNKPFDFVILNGIATNRLLHLAETKGTPALVLISEDDTAGSYPHRNVPRIPAEDVSRVPLIMACMLSAPQKETSTGPRWLGRTALFSEPDSQTRKQEESRGFWGAYRFLRLRYHE